MEPMFRTNTKKDYVYQVLNEENIDICLMQEAEIPIDYPNQLLSSTNYRIEIEKTSYKARCAIAIKNNIQYNRRSDLENQDSSLMIVDVDCLEKLRIINVYCQFNPPHNFTQIDHFSQQLVTIHNSITSSNNRKIIIMGDFNLDENKRHSVDYRYKNLFELQNETFDDLNLIQLVEFPT